jgi:hypothetical protein
MKGGEHSEEKHNKIIAIVSGICFNKHDSGYSGAGNPRK